MIPSGSLGREGFLAQGGPPEVPRKKSAPKTITDVNLRNLRGPVNSFFSDQYSYDALEANRKSIAGEARGLSGLTIGSRWENVGIYASSASNVILLAIKIVALVHSNSLAILASVLDSSLDVLAGMILFFASRIRKSTDRTKYPIGKRRVSPIATLVFAAVMSMAALQIVIEAISTLVTGLSRGSHKPVTVDTLVLAIVVATIALKLSLAVLCLGIAHFRESTILRAYAQDHINDTMTNSVGIAGLLLSANFQSLWYLDSVAAILICSYVAVNWGVTGYQLSTALMGRAADVTDVEYITSVAVTHHPLITGIDTIDAYYMGEKLFVEVHILLPEDTILRTSHDIGESLENVIEQIESVERCFVHLDYDKNHCNEHKQDDGRE